MNKKRVRGLLFLLIVISIVLFAGCDDGKLKEDQNRMEASKRTAAAVAKESERTGLKVCDKPIFIPVYCASGGKDCKKDRELAATDPTACKEPPVLKCICREQTLCVGRIVIGGGIEWGCLGS